MKVFLVVLFHTFHSRPSGQRVHQQAQMEPGLCLRLFTREQPVLILCFAFIVYECVMLFICIREKEYLLVDTKTKCTINTNLIVVF